ncbi:MAG: oxygen-independent coproporphyrinogen III oxidase [Pseudomonadota bacterium]
MSIANTLERAGLFDAKVPRYTSYPPANRFVSGVGMRHQADWLAQIPQGAPLSLYVHIPFCRRLCWFCACRTQGTQTLAPVEAYVDVLCDEIEHVATQHLKPGARMERLHLGGGTPTLLKPDLMARLLDTIDVHFARTERFEFSVEIDPTEAEPDILDLLEERNMTRASIGIQDFDPAVQAAIGRHQSFETTARVVNHLRAGGVRSLNADVLYGLPFQTEARLAATIEKVIALKPDRLALYGYAHVPHVSKRQVMIPSDELPGPKARYDLAELARARLLDAGYRALGIDHFAWPDESLSVAADTGRMTRNFQGYTDDPCAALVAFGASAISRLPGGYVQNAVATSAYVQRIGQGGLAGHKGVCLTSDDRLVAELIDNLMCRGEIDLVQMRQTHTDRGPDLDHICGDLMAQFGELLIYSEGALRLRDGMMPAARLVAAAIDRVPLDGSAHSLAV